MQTLKLFLLTVSVVSLGACSKSGSRSTITDTPSTNLPNLVLGTYEYCQMAGPVSASSVIVVTATDMDFTNIIYDDGACATSRVKYTYKMSYTDVAVSSSLADTRNINLVEGKRYITLLSAAAVTSYNNWNECGFNDWVINVPKDVSGDPTCQEKPVGTITYSIARTVNSTFELGTPVDWMDPAEGATDGARYTIFDPPLTKQ